MVAASIVEIDAGASKLRTALRVAVTTMGSSVTVGAGCANATTGAASAAIASLRATRGVHNAGAGVNATGRRRSKRIGFLAR